MTVVCDALFDAFLENKRLFGRARPISEHLRRLLWNRYVREDAEVAGSIASARRQICEF